MIHIFWYNCYQAEPSSSWSWIISLVMWDGDKAIRPNERCINDPVPPSSVILVPVVASNFHLFAVGSQDWWGSDNPISTLLWLLLAWLLLDNWSLLFYGIVHHPACLPMVECECGGRLSLLHIIGGEGAEGRAARDCERSHILRYQQPTANQLYSDTSRSQPDQPTHRPLINFRLLASSSHWSTYLIYRLDLIISQMSPKAWWEYTCSQNLRQTIITQRYLD